jgi:integrase/recombinase XerC
MPDRELLDGPTALHWASVLGADASLEEAFGLLPTQFAALGSMTEQSTRRFTLEFGRFGRRLQLEHVGSLREVTPEHAARFIDEAVTRGTGYAAPSIATQRFRRSTIRIIFSIFRGLHLVEGDPTLDIELPPRGDERTTRPFEDEEELQGRIWSRQTLVETRMPSLWALGQATATTGEIAHITIGDLALDDGRVRIHGSNKRDPRYGQLTGWGVEQLRRRIGQLDGHPDTRVVFGGALAGASGQASVSSALYVVLVRAGLTDDPGLRAASLPAWAGRRVHDETRSIEETARALGVRSLDQAARLIGYEWR